MTYEEAISDDYAPTSFFNGRAFLPFSLPVYSLFPVPIDAKRCKQFLELYSYYQEDWKSAAAHFQLENFVSSFIFRTHEGYGTVAMTEFYRINRMRGFIFATE